MHNIYDLNIYINNCTEIYNYAKLIINKNSSTNKIYIDSKPLCYHEEVLSEQNYRVVANLLSSWNLIL